MLESFLIKLQALRTAALLNKTPVKFAKFLRTPYFKEHLQWQLPTISDFQPAILIKKRFRQRRFSLNFAEFLRASFGRTPPDDSFLSSEAVVRKCS